MNLKPILLAALLACTGCQYSDMRDRMDEGSALEKEGRRAQRSERYAEAAEFYAQSAVKLEYALKIALERKTVVLSSHVGAELSIVSAGEAFCRRPDNNKAGSWARAYELYATSGMWAEEVAMLKLRRNAKHGQGFCIRPDNNPEGTWEKAAELYAEGVALAKEYKGDEDRAEGMREQALCLMEGDAKRLGENVKARKLLVKARKLDDEAAADILAAAEDVYCIACANVMRRGTKICRECGQDQTDRPKPKPEPPARRPPNAPGGIGGRGGPGGPGGPGPSR